MEYKMPHNKENPMALQFFGKNVDELSDKDELYLYKVLLRSDEFLVHIQPNYERSALQIRLREKFGFID